MEERAEYKNSIRSRMLIRRAFVELMTEKDIDRITVTDIVKRAQINRGTFYAHYQDIRAVSEQIEDDIACKVISLLPEGLYGFYSDPKPFLCGLASFLDDDRRFYASLVSSRGRETLLKRLGAAYTEVLENDQSISPEIKSSPGFRAVHLYVSAGIYNVYREWLTGSLEIDGCELASLAAKLISSVRIPDEPDSEKE